MYFCIDIIKGLILASNDDIYEVIKVMNESVWDLDLLFLTNRDKLDINDNNADLG